MPKKQYRHTEYAKAAKKRMKKKILQIRFELNLTQTEMAKELDLGAHEVESINRLAKKLFLECLEKSTAYYDRLTS